jgi:O-antigen ligase
MAAQGDQGLRRVGFVFPSPAPALAAGVGGLVAGLLIAAGIQKAGPVGAIAPAVLVVGFALLRYPGVMLALLLSGIVLFEPTDPGLLPPVASFYNVIGASMTPLDLLLFGSLAGVLLRFVADSRRPLLPEPMTGPLLLVGVAMITGVVTGYAANAGVPNGELYHRALNEVYIMVIPFLIVNIARDRKTLKLFIFGAAALASIKGLSGAYAALSGSGSGLEGESASYLSPLPNVMASLLVFGVAAAAIRRVRMPLWIWGGAGLATISLLLSYRRSFWIALVLGLIAVAIIASKYRGRTAFVIAAASAALAFAAVATVGGSGPESENAALTSRVQTLNPAGEDTNRGDRYRNDERRNVIATIEEDPLTGVGLGVSWKVHYPIAEAHDRSYVHVAFLWWWLELGPLGALAYVVLMGAGMWTAVKVWRHHPDPLIQVGAIAVFATILGIVIVELTTTFTGIEPRFSIMVGALVGWLCAAWRDIPSSKRNRGSLEASRA